MRFSKFFTTTMLLTIGFQAKANEDDAAAPTTATSFKAMSYNVQNLFDTVDSPDTNDTEFTPTGKQKWTEEVLSDKIKNVGEVIRAEKPAIIAVSELENQAMLDRLVTEGLGDQGYTTVFAGPSDDARGIRTGVISKFPLKSQRSHKVWRDSWGGQKTRDILEVTLVAGRAAGKEILVTVLANHWPSKAGGAQRDVMREEVAKSMEKITKDLLAKDPERLVVAMGDFNAELEEDAFTRGVNLVKNVEDLADAFAGSFFAVDAASSSWAPRDRGTFYFHPERKWNHLDHILVAAGTKLSSGQARGFHVSPESYTRVTPEQFLDTKDHFPNGCEILPERKVFQGRRGNRCPFGASDHLPIAATFELR